MTYQTRSTLTICCLLFASTSVGCATTGNSMQSLVQRFRMKPKTEVADKSSSLAKANSSRDNALLDAAIASWSEADTDETQRLLQQIIDRTPEHREAHHLMADLLASEDKFEAAQQHLQVVLKSDPNDAKAHYAMAMLLDASGNEERAGQHLRRAMQLDPQVEELARKTASDNAVQQVSFQDQAKPVHSISDSDVEPARAPFRMSLSDE